MSSFNREEILRCLSLAQEALAGRADPAVASTALQALQGAANEDSTMFMSPFAELKDGFGRKSIRIDEDDLMDRIGMAEERAVSKVLEGTRELHLDPDGSIDLPSGINEEMPVARMRHYVDAGDSSVGIPSWEAWILDENQTGTILAAMLNAYRNGPAPATSGAFESGPDLPVDEGVASSRVQGSSNAIAAADAILHASSLPTVSDILKSHGRLLDCPDLNLESLEEETVEACEEGEGIRRAFEKPLQNIAPGEPGDFRVRWEIDIDASAASTHAEAALRALEIQRNPESSAVVFDVTRAGESHAVEVDLECHSDEVRAGPRP